MPLNTVHFYCVLCGTSMKASPEIAGDLAECPGCQRMVPMPPPPGEKSVSWAASYPSDIFSVEIKFPCPECGGRLGIDARRSGMAVYCPLCDRVVRVPHIASVADLAPSTTGEKTVVTHPLPRLTAEEIHFLSGNVPEPDRMSHAHAAKG